MKFRKLQQTDKQYLGIWVIAGLFGLCFWLADSVIHYHMYAEHLHRMLFEPPENILDSLVVNISNHTLFVRLTFLLASLIGGGILVRYLRSRNLFEESLHQEQSFSGEIINRSPVIIHAVDLEGKTVLLNPIGERILGYRKNEIVDHSGWEIIRPHQTSEILALWLQEVKQHKLTSEEFSVTTRNGQERIISWNHLVQQDNTGQPTGVISIGRDITDQVYASREINHLLKQQIALNRLALDLGETLDPTRVYHKLHSYLKNIADCWIFLVSSFDSVNNMIRAEYINFEGREQNFADLPPIPLDNEGFGSQSRVIRSGEPLHIPDYSAFSGKSKTTYSIDDKGSVSEGFPESETEEKITQSALYVPMKVGGKTMGVMQLQSPYKNAYSESDIKLLTAVANVATVAAQNARLYAELQVELKERSRIEQEIRTLNEELEERVHERTIELEGLNHELEDFAYIVSHDLKAPLRAVSQLTNWIQSDYADAFDAEGKKLLNLLISRTNRMYNLIQGILDYSRVNRIQQHLQPVDLNATLKEVLDNLNPPPSINIEIPRSLPTIMAAETHMTQVFQNLLDNAIKFMDKDEGQISLTAQQNDQAWHFSIHDNGPGIEEKYHERIFKIFQTLKPRDQVESTGIGLAIVKKILEKIGGTIQVKSQPNAGTTFNFTIPIEEPCDA